MSCSLGMQAQVIVSSPIDTVALSTSSAARVQASASAYSASAFQVAASASSASVAALPTVGPLSGIIFRVSSVVLYDDPLDRVLVCQPLLGCIIYDNMSTTAAYGVGSEHEREALGHVTATPLFTATVDDAGQAVSVCQSGLVRRANATAPWEAFAVWLYPNGTSSSFLS
eukprot:Opistho-2@19028